MSILISDNQLDRIDDLLKARRYRNPPGYGSYNSRDIDLGPVVATVLSASQCPPGTNARYNMPGVVQCRQAFANTGLSGLGGLGEDELAETLSGLSTSELYGLAQAVRVNDLRKKLGLPTDPNLEGLGKLKLKKALKKITKPISKVTKVVAKPLKKIAKPISKITKKITKPLEKVVKKVVPKDIRKFVKKVAAFTPIALVSKKTRKEFRKVVGMRTTGRGKKVAFTQVTPSPGAPTTDPECMMKTECPDGIEITYNACQGLTYEQVCKDHPEKVQALPAPSTPAAPVTQSPVGPVTEIAPGVSVREPAPEVFSPPPAAAPAPYVPPPAPTIEPIAPGVFRRTEPEPAPAPSGGGGGGSSFTDLFKPQAAAEDNKAPAETKSDDSAVDTGAGKPSKMPLILGGLAVVGLGLYLMSKKD